MEGVESEGLEHMGGGLGDKHCVAEAIVNL